MDTLEDLNNRLAVEIRESLKKGKELERLNARLAAALEELQHDLTNSGREEVLKRLREHLQAIKSRRTPALR